MMDHERFQLLAVQQVDGTLTEEEARALAAHLTGCPECRRIASGIERDHRFLVAGLQDAALAPRVVERVLTAARPRRELPRWWVPLGVAGLVVLGFGVSLLGGSRPVVAPTSGPSLLTTASLAAAPSESEVPGPSASIPRSIVNGAYQYSVAPGAQRRDSVTATATDPASGEWSRTVVSGGRSLGGPLTCVVIDGQDAWLAGPATTVSDGQTGLAAFLFVHDAGLAGGAGDTAVTWITDPGQTLATMEGWCRGRFIPAGPYPLEGGDIVIDAGR